MTEWELLKRLVRNIAKAAIDALEELERLLQ